VDEIDFSPFFRQLGARLRAQRVHAKLSQEDMISRGFSARHWQQIEHGRPITLTTLLRACMVFGVSPAAILRGLGVPRSPRSGARAPHRR
jgi:transcriptional regulator with XRE-family HTH domain